MEGVPDNEDKAYTPRCIAGFWEVGWPMLVNSKRRQPWLSEYLDVCKVRWRLDELPCEKCGLTIEEWRVLAEDGD